MNMVAKVTTEERTAYRAVIIADLKERIKNIGATQGHNKRARRQIVSAAAKGTPSNICYPYYDGDWNPTGSFSRLHTEQYLTVLHIIYNRLRRRPAHTGGDFQSLTYAIGPVPREHEKLFSKLKLA